MYLIRVGLYGQRDRVGELRDLRLDRPAQGESCGVHIATLDELFEFRGLLVESFLVPEDGRPELLLPG